MEEPITPVFPSDSAHVVANPRIVEGRFFRCSAGLDVWPSALTVFVRVERWRCEANKMRCRSILWVSLTARPDAER